MTHGQVRVSNELRKKGILVSPSGVRSIWLRHDLANFIQRLKVLEERTARDGLVLTEAQVQALEKKQQMMKPVVKLKRIIPAILAPRTHPTRERSRGSADLAGQVHRLNLN